MKNKNVNEYRSALKIGWLRTKYGTPIEKYYFRVIFGTPTKLPKFGLRSFIISPIYSDKKVTINFFKPRKK